MARTHLILRKTFFIAVYKAFMPLSFIKSLMSIELVSCQPAKVTERGYNHFSRASRTHLPLQLNAIYLQDKEKGLKVEESFPSQHELLSMIFTENAVLRLV